MARVSTRPIASRRRCAVLLAATLVLGVAACGNDSTADSTPATSQSEAGSATSLPADSSALATDPATNADYHLGALRLGLSATTVITLLGEPDSRSDRVEQGADAMFVSTWTYAPRGVTLVMGSESADGAATIVAITAIAPSVLKTAEGIGIGSDEAAVQTAYEEQINTEESGEGSFVIGSLYGGMVLEMANGKVLSIFIGAAAE